MNDSFMTRLSDLREALQTPFVISSGYRCVRHNLTLTGKSKGAHTLGRAVDIILHGKQALELIQVAPHFGMTGIGIKQHGPMGARFIHLDDLTSNEGFVRPTVWSYAL